MSLMGYTIEDIHDMQDSLITLKSNIKNTKHPQYEKVMHGIELALSLLEGLLEEGRVA